MTIPAAWYDEWEWDDMQLFMDEVDDKWQERGYPDLEEAFYQSVQYMEPKEFLGIKKRLSLDWGVQL